MALARTFALLAMPVVSGFAAATQNEAESPTPATQLQEPEPSAAPGVEPLELEFTNSCVGEPIIAFGKDVAPNIQRPRLAAGTALRTSIPEHRKELKNERNRVVVRLLVNETGAVVRARLVESSGSPRFDRNAMLEMGRWSLTGGAVNGKPACTWGLFAIGYSPPRPPPQPPPPPVEGMKMFEFNAKCGSDENAYYNAPRGAILTPPLPERGAGRAPQTARRVPKGTQVLVLMFVNEHGNVVRSRVEKSSGIEEVDRSVAEQAKYWLFRPAKIDRYPACAWASVLFTSDRK